MKCKSCQKEIPDGSLFCNYCGRKQERVPSKRTRGNGQGTVYKVGNKYRAIVTLGYYTDEKTGKRKRKTRSERFSTKKEAIAALPRLANTAIKKERTDITFKALYDKWFPTHSAGKSTMENYSSAMNYFEPVWFMKMKDIDIDDLQECVDECGYGKRTKQNMKTVCGLIYKYGIPRDMIPNDRNLSQFLKVNGNSTAHRESFTDSQIASIKKQIGKTWGAEYVYCLCYLGFRPSEFLALGKDDYNEDRQCIIGGAKTDAGKGRTVTLSPKITVFMGLIKKHSKVALVHDKDGNSYSLKSFTEDVFYPVLDAAGIENPVVTDEFGNSRHKYTPHSCRHTFSTLMKRVQGSDKDKLELIGHTSTEMLRYYQDVNLDDLRQVTDAI